MAHIRSLALAPSIAAAVERNDGDALVRLLAPMADDPQLDEAISAAASVVPHLAARPESPSWPQSIAARCMALVTDEMRRPRSDRCLADTAPPPTSWNWLISVREVLAGRDGVELPALRRALETGAVDAAAHMLDGQSPDGALRAWQALLVTSILLQRGNADTRARAETALLAGLERSPADFPAPVLAMLVVQRTLRRDAPPAHLCKHLDALRPGASDDLTLAAALIGWVEAGPLSPTYANRLVVDASTRQVLIEGDKASSAWLHVMRRVLTAGGPRRAEILSSTNGSEPDFGETINVIRRLAAATGNDPLLPTTAWMANGLLVRLRRRDLVVADNRTPAPLAHAFMSRSALAHLGSPPGMATARPNAVNAHRTTPHPITVGARISPERISICIINTNQSAQTHRLLSSLQRLWPTFSGHVLLFDNGSAALDFEALAAHALEVWPGHVRVFRSDEPIPAGAAYNVLCAQVSTPWVLSLHSAIMLTADLGAHLLPLVEASRAAFFNLAVDDIDQGDIDAPGFDHAAEAKHLHSGACLFETAAFAAVGGFAAGAVHGEAEDDLSRRITEHGYAIETLGSPVLLHGQLAPGRAADVVAVCRADRAHNGSLAAPHLILPRRLDFRHVNSPAFFSPLRPGARTVAFLREGILYRIVPPLLEWVSAHGGTIEVRDQNEFSAPEQALLAMQACAVIVGGPAMLRLSPQRCADLGLLWPSRAPRLVVLAPAPETAAPKQPLLYPGGPDLTIAHDAEQLVAGLRAALGEAQR